MQDMTSFLRVLLVVVITAFTGQAIAQGTSGSIIGTIIDENNEPVFSAQIQVFKGGIAKGGAVPDFDGNYVIKPLDPGSYELRIKDINYKESIVTDILVEPGKPTEVNVTMQKKNVLDEVQIVRQRYVVPLIDKYSGGSTTTKTAEEIEKMPTRNTATVVSTSVGAYAQKDGGEVSIAGARSDGTLYIIDGVQVVGNRGINVSQNAIEQVQVMTSGISAKYGDAIGGVVSITTKGVSDKLRGGILLERSLEGFNHNLVNFTLSGPLLRKKIDTLGNTKPIMGFFLSGDLWYDEDRDPEYHGNYAVKEEVLNDIRENPLFSVPNASGVPVFRNRAETVTADDLYITKRRQSAEVIDGRLTGRLDFQLNDNLNISAGGTYNYRQSKRYDRALSMFAVDGIANEFNHTGRGFIRLRQSFKNNSSNAATLDGEVEEKPIISNAFYTLQADYQIDSRKIEHAEHKENVFNYGYVGKFYTDYESTYIPGGVDSATGQFGTLLQADRNAQQTRYERSDLNPLLANYVSQYYRELDGPSPEDIQYIRGRAIPVNGDRPGAVYGLFHPTGIQQNFFYQGDIQQYSVSVDASFDLQPRKTRHSIEFGLYYQQRTESSYQVVPTLTTRNLWQYMRQLTNTHIGLDKDNPIFIIDGQEYTKDQIGGTNGILRSPSDTILYNRTVVGEQSVFDKNLRQKLGVSATDYIEIDELDPSTFSLDMFSADELFNSGNQFVFYSGYDYKGNRQRGQVNFNDFFTKKDENGNYTRDIGSYRPNYIAGYILDKFKYKDIIFNVGLRIERFDANTKVLKDPYSLYDINSVGDARGITDGLGNVRVVNNYIDVDDIAPSNIGDDYAVYVNNNEAANPQVVGYRDGDDWYDPLGRLIDPALLQQNYNNGSAPQPYLVNKDSRIQDTTFDPTSSFTDYKPQINVVPRISFNFPITEEALFYAHYDVLVQRPKSGVYTRPDEYYYLTANTGGFLNNPDLKPEKMFDYEIGFKQKLSNFSALTISGFYKERKDMIQVRPYLYAWPTTYYTYGNRDFTTTKGMTLRYDMRRNGPLRLDLAYTLQFANGTGSNRNSSSVTVGNTPQPTRPGLLQGFISAGVPNLRTVFPLDNDVRHNIVATIDYRYREGKGPLVGNKYILENAGANLIFRTRSGEPYTKYTQPQPINNTIEGSPNGARLPWHYMIDLRLDKDFKIYFGKKEEGATKRKKETYLNVYVLVNNLLNTRDILDVDRFTGRPDDNGYLAHPIGVQRTNNEVNPQSFVDLYSANLIGTGNTRLNLPRRINLGLNFNF